MSEKVLGFYEEDARLCQSKERQANQEFFYDIYKKNLVSVRLASESVGLKEYKRVLEENKVLKQALKYLCNQNSITYDCFWKRIKPDKWRDYIAKIIKTE